MPTEDIGEKIKTYRRNLGLSQKALAKRLKIDPSTLALWEKGKGWPSKEFLQTVADFFTFLSSKALNTGHQRSS